MSKYVGGFMLVVQKSKTEEYKRMTAIGFQIEDEG